MGIKQEGTWEKRNEGTEESRAWCRTRVQHWDLKKHCGKDDLLKSYINHEIKSHIKKKKKKKSYNIRQMCLCTSRSDKAWFIGIQVDWYLRNCARKGEPTDPSQTRSRETHRDYRADKIFNTDNLSGLGGGRRGWEGRGRTGLFFSA